MAINVVIPTNLALMLVILASPPMATARDGDVATRDGPATLILTSEQLKKNGVVIGRVAKREVSKTITAPGEVVLDAYQSSKVTPRIASHVLARHVILGEGVTKGQPLVRLSSVEMARAQGEALIAANEWRRIQKIGRETVSDRRFTEAQVAMQQAIARVQTFGMTQAQVREFLNTNDSSQATGAYNLLSPQNGTVMSDDFLVGERVEAGQILFELTDESTLWVEAKVSAPAANQIREATVARVSVDGAQWQNGEILLVSHSLDEQTRTRMVRIQLDNQDDLFHRGEFVQVELELGGGSEAIIVPKTAVVNLQGSSAVFQVIGRDRLQAVTVETGRVEGSWVEIRSGLSADDEVAIEGAFGLKAELLNQQGGD